MRLPLGFGEAWFAPPKAVIVNKLIFFREGGSEKHIKDIRAMLVGGHPIENQTVLRWAGKLGLLPEWEKVCAGS